MKRKEWEEKIQNRKLPDPIKGNPIICPACGHLIGHDKDYMFVIIPDPGIVCPQCDEIVIWNIMLTFRQNPGYTGDPPIGLQPISICNCKSIE
jgi:hypothetical protein